MNQEINPITEEAIQAIMENTKGQFQCLFMNLEILITY